MSTRTNISFQGYEIELHFTPSNPGVRWHADGSGTPPEGPEIDIVSVYDIGAQAELTSTEINALVNNDKWFGDLATAVDRGGE